MPEGVRSGTLGKGPSCWGRFSPEPAFFVDRRGETRDLPSSCPLGFSAGGQGCSPPRCFLTPLTAFKRWLFPMRFDHLHLTWFGAGLLEGRRPEVPPGRRAELEGAQRHEEPPRGFRPGADSAVAPPFWFHVFLQVWILWRTGPRRGSWRWRTSLLIKSIRSAPGAGDQPA